MNTSSSVVYDTPISFTSCFSLNSAFLSDPDVVCSCSSSGVTAGFFYLLSIILNIDPSSFTLASGTLYTRDPLSPLDW